MCHVNPLTLLGVSEYSKRECIEISGIPTSVDHKELEPSVCKFLQHIGVDTEERIESCHYINRFNNRTILKFCRCKDCEKLMSLKSELNNLVSSDIGLSKAFHNEILCPQYKSLSNECKKLKNEKSDASTELTTLFYVRMALFYFVMKFSDEESQSKILSGNSADSCMLSLI